MDILGIVDPHGGAGEGAVGGDDDLGDAAEFERDLGCRRDQAGLSFQVGLEPEVLGQRAGMVVPVIEVRRHAQAEESVGHVTPRPGHVVHVRVEIIGRREPERRYAEPTDVRVLRDRRQFERRGLGPLAAGHLVERGGEVA